MHLRRSRRRVTKRSVFVLSASAAFEVASGVASEDTSEEDALDAPG
jgi:hypothetical protein